MESCGKDGDKGGMIGTMCDQSLSLIDEGGANVKNWSDETR